MSQQTRLYPIENSPLLKAIEDIQVTDWLALDVYARRVKILCLDTTNRVIVLPYVYTMISQARSAPLLPSLKEIRLRANHSDNFSDAFLVTGPHLKLVECTQPVVATPKFLIPFLFTALQCSPALQEFIIQGNTQVDLRFVSRFKGLRRLDLKLTQNHLTPEFFNILGCLEHLNEISIHAGLFSLTHIPPPLRTDQHLPCLDPPASPMFKALRSLDVSGSLKIISVVLLHITLDNLISIRIQEESNGVSNTELEWKFCCRRLISSRNCLKKLEVLRYPRAVLQVKWMKPLFRLTRLESLIIRNGSFWASEDDISTLLRSYPSLKTLILPESWYNDLNLESSDVWSLLSNSQPRLAVANVRSLINISNLCPLLEELRLPIGGGFKSARIQIKEALASQTVKCKKSSKRHPLRTLGLNSSFEALQNEDVASLARLIFRTYPNLEIFEGTGPNRGGECWSNVWVVYKAIQSEVRFSTDD